MRHVTRCRHLQDRSSELAEAERTLRMALTLLSKLFLHLLPRLHKLPDFQVGRTRTDEWR